MKGLSIAVLTALLPWSGPARAAEEPASSAPPADTRRAEAAERFDRGISLLEEGDFAAALAELTHVYRISPHPQVLYNIGLVYAAMNRPVDATRALAQVLAAPGTLPADSVARARRTRDDQARRVALLDVTSNVPATIEADGIELGKTPFDKPVDVAAGALVIAAKSPGYLPIRREITVAGQTTEKVHFELLPSDLRLAHLSIRSALPDAEVVVDGEKVGRTPLPSSIALAPGRRSVELRRAGYRPARQEIALDAGATGELTFSLAAEEGARARWGRLVLVSSEADADIFVDGQPRGAYRGPLSLPPGSHALKIARAGFLPAERTVVVPENAEAVARVTLVPTPETRAAHMRSAGLQRTWGWIGTVGGAAVALGAGALLVVNSGPLTDAEARYDKAFARNCNLVMLENYGECVAAQSAAAHELDKRELVRNLSFVSLGVGIAAAGVGLALLLTGDDPDRYDRAPRESDKLALRGWVARGGGGLAVGRAF